MFITWHGNSEQIEVLFLEIGTSVDDYRNDNGDDNDDESYHPDDDQQDDDDDDYFDDSDGDDQAPYNHPPVQQTGDIDNKDNDNHSWVPNDDYNDDDDVPLVADLDGFESSTTEHDGDQGNDTEDDNEEDDWNDGSNSGEEDQKVAAEGLENQGVENPTQDQGLEDRNEVEEQAQLEQRMDELYGERSGWYGLRPHREPKYAGVPRSHLHMTVTESATIQLSGGGKTWATAQVMMDKGVKMFGSDGLVSVKTEMKQLHDCKVMRPRFKKELTSQQHSEALSYLMFLKRKRCGKIKSRGVQMAKTMWEDPPGRHNNPNHHNRGSLPNCND